MGEMMGGTNGYAATHLEGGWPGCLRELRFDLQQRVIRQSSLFEGAPRVSWSSHWSQPQATPLERPVRIRAI